MNGINPLDIKRARQHLLEGPLVEGILRAQTVFCVAVSPDEVWFPEDVILYLVEQRVATIVGNRPHRVARLVE